MKNISVPSKHLLVQSSQKKQKKNVWNLLKVIGKDTRKMSMISFWCLYKYFILFSSVSVVKLEQVNVC